MIKRVNMISWGGKQGIKVYRVSRTQCRSKNPLLLRIGFLTLRSRKYSWSAKMENFVSITQYNMKYIIGTILESLFCVKWDNWFIRVGDRIIFTGVNLAYFWAVGGFSEWGKMSRLLKVPQKKCVYKVVISILFDIFYWRLVWKIMGWITLRNPYYHQPTIIKNGQGCNWYALNNITR